MYYISYILATTIKDYKLHGKQKRACHWTHHSIYLQTALFSDDAMFSLGGIAGCLRFLCISENVT